MKAKLSLFGIVLIIISTAWISPVATTTSNGQDKVSAKLNPSFSFVRAHRQGKGGATTSWGLTSVEGVIGFTVQKTYEDPTDPYAFWEDLCNIACNPSSSFKHTDKGVSPGYINYRVLAHMDNGSAVMSENVAIRIVQH